MRKHVMNRVYFKASRVLAGVLMCLALVACDKAQSPPAAQAGLAFHPGDECHVCGMVISDFPGPKGAAVGAGGTKKFCSPAEMLGWWLQPENHRADVKLYVHDMGRSHWDAPDDAHLIDARTAYFVIGSRLKGAMGVVLASFSNLEAAQKLAHEAGGKVLRLEDIDQKLLGQAGAMSSMSH
jgi:copper chaperone NosL